MCRFFAFSRRELAARHCCPRGTLQGRGGGTLRRPPKEGHDRRSPILINNNKNIKKLKCINRIAPLPFSGPTFVVKGNKRETMPTNVSAAVGCVLSGSTRCHAFVYCLQLASVQTNRRARALISRAELKTTWTRRRVG